jgi:SprT protein
VSLTEDKLKLVTAKVDETVSQLNSIYNFHMLSPSIYFDITGFKAGLAKYKTMSIHFNPVLANENWDSFLNEIVPHEVCHIAVWHWCNYFKKKLPKTPHDLIWKTMMLDVGLTPNVTHNYDLSNVRKKKIKQFTYACSCSTPTIVSSIVHNRILKGALYRCYKCSITLSDGILKTA